MRKKIHVMMVFGIIISFIIILHPTIGYACSCAEIPTVEAEIERSQAVFSGRVIQIKEQRHINGYLTKSILFEVSKTWKGISKSQVIITTGSGGGDCGYEFEQGKEYLVYAKQSSMYGDKNTLVTIICDRTNEVSQAQEDLAILKEGKVPTEQVNLEGKLNGISAYFWVLAIPIIGIVVFAVCRRLTRN